MLLSRSNKADLDLNLLRFSECSYIFHRLLDIIRCNTHKPKSKTCTVDNNLQMKIFESYKNTEAFLLRTFTRNRKVHYKNKTSIITNITDIHSRKMDKRSQGSTQTALFSFFSYFI